MLQIHALSEGSPLGLWHHILTWESPTASWLGGLIGEVVLGDAVAVHAFFATLGISVSAHFLSFEGTGEMKVKVSLWHRVHTEEMSLQFITWETSRHWHVVFGILRGSAIWTIGLCCSFLLSETKFVESISIWEVWQKPDLLLHLKTLAWCSL